MPIRKPKNGEKIGSRVLTFTTQWKPVSSNYCARESVIRGTVRSNNLCKIKR